MDEIELKFLDINVDEIKQKLEKLGAKLKFAKQIESHEFFAEGFHNSDSSKKFLRVRKVNEDVQITYKDPAKDSDMSDREEIEITTIGNIEYCSPIPNINVGVLRLTFSCQLLELQIRVLFELVSSS